MSLVLPQPAPRASVNYAQRMRFSNGENSLETIFDWISIAIFAGLIVLFLQRSSEAVPKDRLWQYLAPAAGCAVANYLGNEGYRIFAVLVIVAILGFVWFVLKPLDGWSKNQSG